jgi:hypothetical protein
VETGYGGLSSIALIAVNIKAQAVRIGETSVRNIQERGLDGYQDSGSQDEKTAGCATG